MNITSFSISQSSVFLTENILSSMKAQQKKILTIAALAFTCFAACWLVAHFCFKGNSQRNKGDLEIDEVTKEHLSPKRETGESKNVPLNEQGNITLPKDEVQIDQLNDEEKINSHVEREGELIESKFIQQKITLADGTTMEGEFEENDLVKGKITYANTGRIEEGEFQEGILRKGKIIYPTGRIEEGEFQEGRLNGKGKITWKDGEVWEGFFKDGSLPVKLVATYSYDNTSGN